MLPSDADLPPSGAVLSECGRYRYALWRTLPLSLLMPDLGALLFVMLNPSTADAKLPDATITKLLGYAERWGYTRLFVGNLYALRSRHPKVLLTAGDPVGPQNDEYLREELVSRANRVVVAWGDGPRGLDIDTRAAEVLSLLGDPHCLARTRAGRPGHPLYLPSSATPTPYAKAA